MKTEFYRCYEDRGGKKIGVYLHPETAFEESWFHSMFGDYLPSGKKKLKSQVSFYDDDGTRDNMGFEIIINRIDCEEQ